MKKNERPTLRKQANSVKKTNAYHLKKQAPPHKKWKVLYWIIETIKMKPLKSMGFAMVSRCL